MTTELIEQLRLAVAGPYDVEANDDDIETLLWRVGEMRRQLEAAHNGLDSAMVPRRVKGGALTVAGRIERLRFG